MTCLNGMTSRTRRADRRWRCYSNLHGLALLSARAHCDTITSLLETSIRAIDVGHTCEVAGRVTPTAARVVGYIMKSRRVIPLLKGALSVKLKLPADGNRGLRDR
jgi:hypothetical protein